MMNNMIGNNIASIEKMTDIIGKKNSDNVDKMYNGKTFALIYIIRSVRLKRLFPTAILNRQKG